MIALPSISIDEHRKRISALKKLLTREARHTVALTASAPLAYSGHDMAYSYRPDSNFRYLTGSQDQSQMLLVDPTRKRPVLLVQKEGVRKIKYAAPLESSQILAHRLDAELIESENLDHEALKLIRHAEVVAVDFRVGNRAFDLVTRFFELPRAAYRTRLSGCLALDIFTAELRIVKSKAELACLEEAHRLSVEALYSILPFITKGGATEHQIARHLDLHLSSSERVGFPTIVAAGVNASYLHHVPTHRRIRRGESLLIDCGAEHEGYVADITRMLPIGGAFSDHARALYGLVLEAYHETVAAIRPGRSCRDVFEVERRALAKGLKRLSKRSGLAARELTMRIPTLFASAAGHVIGMDVHDIGQDYLMPRDVEIKVGSVFAVETGIYLSERLGEIPRQGIRIEDDYIVTPRGVKPLGNEFPLEINEIEAVCGVASRS